MKLTCSYHPLSDLHIIQAGDEFDSLRGDSWLPLPSNTWGHTASAYLPFFKLRRPISTIIKNEIVL